MSYISAIAAYKKIMHSAMIEPSSAAQNLSVLRKGDDLSKSEVSKNDFAQVLEKEFVQKPISSIKSNSRALFEISKQDSQSQTKDIVELIEEMDKMQTTISYLVATRDRIVNAYLEIMKMPI